MSPAGSFDSLQAAIKGGADAIYFGVEQLNMRAKSVNGFSVEDIKEVSKTCKDNNIKCYLTLNTVIYDHDIQLAKKIIKECKKQGVNAIIASDFAIIELCKKENIPVHISTQTNVSNIEAVQFFASAADVVVLARELTLKQVEQICKDIKRKKINGISGEKLKIEVFVHGALCMAVSGKCYMSLHTQNASANRGACTQNCRRPYKVTDMETNTELVIDNEYIMSPKDLCTIDIMDQLVNTGVDVLKIEGRGKSADYVYTVTKCYREALQSIREGTYTRDKIDAWKTELSSVYNRGFWEGYYLGRQLGEWTPDPGSIATTKKNYLGKGTKYYPKIKVAEFLVESGTLKTGDTIMISGPKVGMLKETIGQLFVNGEPAAEAKKGDRITILLGEKISLNDKLYKLTDN